jgi:O-antigen/teichoic acid export membrane protein
MKEEKNIKSYEERKGYKNAFKATALFGGAQSITIIILIVKSKLVAIWLGTFGLGLMGLFSTAINLISAISNLGLQSSAVREIAYAYGKNDISIISKTVKALNRWVVAIGFIGMLVAIALSPLLSQLYFKNYGYTISFVFLSIIVLLNGIWQQQLAFLQGMRQLKQLVKASIYGAVLSFVCSVPILYVFRNDGIAWSLIITSLSSLAATYIYARKTELLKIEQSYRESYYLGKNAAKLGMAMALSGIMVSVVEFCVRGFIARNGSVSDVGLYSAGWALNGQYLGLVFNAMAKDYLPRLSQHSDNMVVIRRMVNEQGEIALLVLAPIIIVMLVFLPFFVGLVYSTEFVLATPMIKWLLIGSFIKAGAWGLSFVFLAKSDSKNFLFNEVGIMFVTLPSYLLGYHFYGLLGIGYAFTFIYAVYLLWMIIVAQRKYQISYTFVFAKIFSIFMACIICYMLSERIWGFKYWIGISSILFIYAYSFYEFNKRIPLQRLLLKWSQK